jgi:hypothetical protein
MLLQDRTAIFISPNAGWVQAVADIRGGASFGLVRSANRFAGTAALANGTVTIPSLSARNSRPACAANGTSAAIAVRVQTTATTLTLSETGGTDVINWSCVANLY